MDEVGKPIEGQRKSLLVAYGLWLLSGLVGGHRFYLRRPFSALSMAALTLGGVAMVFTPLLEWSRITLIGVLWFLLDAFLIPRMAGRRRKTLAEDVLLGPVVILKASGWNGSVEVTDRSVIIDRRGFVAAVTHGFASRKEIPFTSITAVQFKDAGMFFNGMIQFTIPGAVERQGLLDSTSDENAVIFMVMQQKRFVELRRLLSERIGARATPVAPLSAADEIGKLVALRDRGILSADEFEARKRAELSRT